MYYAHDSEVYILKSIYVIRSDKKDLITRDRKFNFFLTNTKLHY